MSLQNSGRFHPEEVTPTDSEGFEIQPQLNIPPPIGVKTETAIISAQAAMAVINNLKVRSPSRPMSKKQITIQQEPIAKDTPGADGQSFSRPTEELTPRQVRLNEDREQKASINKLQNQIQTFANSCSNLDQIRPVLRSLNRVNFPPKVAASIYAQPQELPVANLIQGSMKEGAIACKVLLRKAFSLANSLHDINKIIACDYRIASLASNETEVPDGSPLYGIEEELLAIIQNNDTVRAEIIQAKVPESERSQTYGHFIHFCREIGATKTISAALMELEAKAFGDEIKAVVQGYA